MNVETPPDNDCVLANVNDSSNFSMAFQFAPSLAGGFSVGVSSSPPLEKKTSLVS